MKKNSKKIKQVKLPDLSNLTPQEIAKAMLNTPPEKKSTKKGKIKKKIK